MVGVPRSKGCRICVQRRVKCDLTKPICNNCKKGNRPCPGYEQDLKFQDEGVRLRKRFEKPPTQQGAVFFNSGPSLLPDESASESSEEVQWVPREAETGYATMLPNNKVVPYRNPFFRLLEFDYGVVPTDDSNSESEEQTTIYNGLLSTGRVNLDKDFRQPTFNPTIFSPHLVQDQLLSLFTTSIAPGRPVGLPKQLLFYGRWLSHLPSLSGTDNLLDTAVRAVSLAHLGRLHGSDVFLHESRPYYGKALRLLSSSISDQAKGMASETLSATILLSFYEMFASNSNDSWIRHAGGASALMKVRGPARHRHGFDREIFLAYRHTIIIEAFQKDERCFLDDAGWCEVSRQVHEDIRNTGIPLDRMEIFDLAEEFYLTMVPTPGMVHDARNIRDAFEAQNMVLTIRDFKDDLVRRFHKHRSELKSIYTRFRAALVVAGLSPRAFVSGDPVIPVYYTHPNIFVGSICIGHWTITMILNLILEELEKSLHPQNTAMYKMENREYGLEVCRSISYMLTSSFIGPFFSVFGLRMCLLAFEEKDDRDWVITKLFEIGNTHMRMATHIPGFAPGTGLPRVRAAMAEVDNMQDNTV